MKQHNHLWPIAFMLISCFLSFRSCREFAFPQRVPILRAKRLLKREEPRRGSYRRIADIRASANVGLKRDGILHREHCNESPSLDCALLAASCDGLLFAPNFSFTAET
jgi:hypothetical protein